MSGPSGAELLQALLVAGAITPADLDLLPVLGSVSAPTYREYLPSVLDRCPPRSLSTYGTTFRRLAARFEDRQVTTVTTKDLQVLARELRRQSASRRGSGVGAERGFVHGARFWGKCMVQDGLMLVNPAAALEMPPRPRRVRRALTQEELRDVYEAVLETSSDPELDLLLLDFHRETAARRGGAVGLMLADLNRPRGAVLVHEKYDNEREIPCSQALMHRIVAHAEGRPGPIPAAFRYPDGHPLTRRRYNTLFERVQAVRPWAARLGVSVHWLRHTTLTDIALATNSRIAAEYAGHTDASVTDAYTVPTFEDLVRAHRRVFGS